MNIKNHKKAVSLILALVLAFNLAIPAFATTTSNEVVGKAGTEVTVQFVYENIRGLEVEGFSFSDPNMVASVKDLKVTGFSVVSYEAEDRHLIAFNMNSNVVKKSVLTLTFTLAYTTQPKSFDIELNYILALEDGQGNIVEEAGTEKVTVNVTVTPADVSELQLLIQTAEGKDKNNYTADSWEALEQALSEARIAINSNDQEVVDTAVEKLGAAINALESLVLNYSELEAYIREAESLNESIYTTESWDALTKALANAKAVLESRDQDVIDAAAVELGAAIEGLVKKNVDMTGLKAVIAEAESLNESDYTPESWANMQAVLAVAKNYMDPNRGQEFIDQLTSELRIAIDSLVRVNTPAEVDYSRLIAKISAALSLNQEDYTETSWANLYAVVMQAAYALESKDQAVVDAAAQSIDDAIAALVFKPTNSDPDINYTALLAAIETAKGLREENYTTESWAVLENALSIANTALTATLQETVDAATRSLNDAIEALVENIDNPPPVIDYTKLDELIARAEELDETKYTEATWEALKGALITAKAMRSSKVQYVVDSAAAALESAINGLQEKNTVTPTPPSPDDLNYAELVAQIGIAKALIERNYTSDSWRRMTEALAVAEAALESTEQSFVDSAAQNLKQAIEALVVVEENDNPDMLWLVIALASVIAAAGIAAVIVIIIKKKSEKDTTPFIDYDIEEDN